MTKTRRSFFAIVAASLLSLTTLTACEESGGGSCGGAQTCGGDIVGTWAISSSCFSGDASYLAGLDCPSAKVDLSGIKASGTVTYNADKTGQGNYVLSGDMGFDFPTSCFGGSLSCDQLGARVMTELALDDESPFTAASCRKSDIGCACTFTLKPKVSGDGGTYTTSGASLVETDTDGDVTTSTYCVEGSKLTEHTVEMSMGKVVFSGTLVLAKK